MNLHKKVEGILYNYKSIKAEINSIKIEIEDIESQYEGISGISYEEKTGPTNKFNSSVENEIVNKENMIKRLKKELSKKEALIKKVDNAVETLNETERKVIEMKCFERLQYKYIEQRLSINKDYACELKRRSIGKMIPLICVREYYQEIAQ
ncbi:siderophore-interacting protein [Clostridium botulinum]|uniref:siderophore-interacting protein n=1 Tax=Clostridium botulinum TaxID=1491 RepID=UPI0013FCDB60|nr:siderophore-interacting protein [Clostridium botulinum]MCD3217470.1 siderophore-interacting protein [Clostridium botulinum C]NFV47549.1 siderophore-interacting protein [Clostridium botulinum]